MAAVVSMLLLGASGIDPKKMDQESNEKQYEYGSNEYYKDLLENRIEVDTLFEGNFRVHYINGDKEIIKEYLSYSRLDTTEMNGEKVIDSVMTYYELSLSPTRHSILIQEYVYPKSTYNMIKDYFEKSNRTYDNIELRMINAWDQKNDGRMLIKSNLIDFKSELIGEFNRDLFHFEDKEIDSMSAFIKRNYGAQSSIILISNETVVISPTNAHNYDIKRIVNKKGNIIKKMIGYSNIKFNQVTFSSDTLFFVIKEKVKVGDVNFNEEIKLKLYKIVDDELVDSTLVYSGLDNINIMGINASVNGTFVAIQTGDSGADEDLWEVINCKNKNVKKIYNLGKRRTLESEITLIEDNILILNYDSENTTVMVNKIDGECELKTFQGRFKQLFNINLFILNNSSEFYKFNVKENVFDIIHLSL